MICENCKKEFFDKKHKTRRFCSRKCVIRTSEWYDKVARSQKGEKSHRWKGGVIYRHGYRYILSTNHPYKSARGYVAEHRLIVEKREGRFLSRSEHVHHINGNILDNSPENLIITTNRDHIFKHKMWLRRTQETYDKIGHSHKGKPLSEEHKKKISLANKGKKRTEKTRKRMRDY